MTLLFLLISLAGLAYRCHTEYLISYQKEAEKRKKKEKEKKG